MFETNPGSKAEQVANALSGLLAGSDRFVVEVEGDIVVARPISDKDSLKALNPDLHGRLLKYEQKLLGLGNGFWLFLLGALVTDLVISKNWLHSRGLDLAELQSWWVYVSMFVLAFILHNSLLTSGVARRYKEHAGEIKDAIERAGLTPGEVISMTAKDSALFNVRQRLMLD